VAQGSLLARPNRVSVPLVGILRCGIRMSEKGADGHWTPMSTGVKYFCHRRCPSIYISMSEEQVGSLTEYLFLAFFNNWVLEANLQRTPTQSRDLPVLEIKSELERLK